MSNPDNKDCRVCYFFEKQGAYYFCMRYPATKSDVAIEGDGWCGGFARKMKEVTEKEND